VGLGLRFLKHISRTSALAFLVDLSDENWEEAYGILLSELSSFAPALVQKRRVLIATKLDLPEAAERFDAFRAAHAGRGTVFGISVFSGQGIDELRDAFFSIVSSPKRRPRRPNLDEDLFGLDSRGRACGGRGGGSSVLGGSFNPVHIGHLAMADELRAEFGYDLVVLVPSFRPPHKELAEEPGADRRLAMLRLAVGEDPGIAVDDCEIEGAAFPIRSTPSRTWLPLYNRRQAGARHRRRSHSRLPLVEESLRDRRGGRHRLRAPIERGGAAPALPAPLRAQQPHPGVEQHGSRAHRRGPALQAPPSARRVRYIVENGLYGLR
jgi:cytidyltransferase-like protein